MSSETNGGRGSDNYPCGGCGKEVLDDHEAIYCESGCEQWYHRDCTGMSRLAYDLLTAEDSAEWACDTCVGSKAIPIIKMVSKN